jgi:DNA topoisomerase-1
MAAAFPLPLDPAESARVAGLRHVDPDSMPGFTRVRKAKGFAYVDALGRRLRDADVLNRIRKLAIPPAWESVWICPVANGHIQARGHDARGRKQYRYEARWSDVRSATKFHKMLAFSRALPRIRAACDRDIARRDLSRDKVLATAVRLLELTHIRVGNEEYARANGSFGLTTLRNRHVDIHGAEMRFHFRGKSGKNREVDLRDRRLARVVAQCSELPGHELFQFVAEDGTLHGIDSGDINEYIRRIAGEEFTAKDFRTWAGTVLAVRTLSSLAPCTTKGRVHKNIVECIKTVAARLGNTPAVCKRSYVHPAVIDAYRVGSLARAVSRGRRSDEDVVRAIVSARRLSESKSLTDALRSSLRRARSTPDARSARWVPRPLGRALRKSSRASSGPLR